MKPMPPAPVVMRRDARFIQKYSQEKLNFQNKSCTHQYEPSYEARQKIIKKAGMVDNAKQIKISKKNRENAIKKL